MKFFLLFFLLLSSVDASYIRDRNGYNHFSPDEIEEFSQDAPFEIVSGSLHVNDFGKFADGDYYLKSAKIRHSGKYLYRIKMNFVLHKRRYLSYTKTITLDVLYKGSRFWIKYRGKVYKYRKPQSRPFLITQRKSHKYHGNNNLHVRLKNLSFVVSFDEEERNCQW